MSLLDELIPWLDDYWVTLTESQLLIAEVRNVWAAMELVVEAANSLFRARGSDIPQASIALGAAIEELRRLTEVKTKGD